MFDISLIVNIVAACAAILSCAVALYVYWDSSSPDVQVYLESDREEGNTILVVKNFERKPAYDVEIKGFDYSFVQDNFKNMLSNPSLVKEYLC